MSERWNHSGTTNNKTLHVKSSEWKWDRVLTMLLLKSSGFLIHLPFSHSISTIKNTVDQSSIQAMPSAQDTMEPIPAKSIQVCNAQINKILSNTLYLTLNAPKVDEYVCLS